VVGLFRFDDDDDDDDQSKRKKNDRLYVSYRRVEVDQETWLHKKLVPGTLQVPLIRNKYQYVYLVD